MSLRWFVAVASVGIGLNRSSCSRARRFAGAQTPAVRKLSIFAFPPLGAVPIALFRYAAEALVREYLEGRWLSEALRGQAVRTVQMRLIQGWLPLLDDSLRAQIDAVAVPTPSQLSRQMRGSIAGIE